MFCALEDYALLYSDLGEVVLISGSTKEFKLQRRIRENFLI